MPPPPPNLRLDDEFAEEGGYYGGLTTLSDGTGQSKPDTVQADIDKFKQDPRNQQGMTAGDRTDQEDAGKVVTGYVNDEPVYGSLPVASTESRNDIFSPQNLIKPKDAQETTVAATKKVAENNVLSAMEIRGIEKETANDVKGLLSSFSDKYKKLAKDDPYKMQKFWFTVGSNIMKKGNAFANLTEGLKIAVDDLDGTRKEKNKLLMELEDTLTKANVKLTEKEGTSKVNLEKLTNKQKNLLAKLDPKGIEAFNKQVKANQSFMAALTAARKAETAARTEARKNKAKGAIDSGDIKNLNDVFNNAFESVTPFYGIGKGKSMDKKQADYKASVMDKAVKIASGEGAYKGKTGMVAANSFIQNQARTYKKK